MKQFACFQLESQWAALYIIHSFDWPLNLVLKRLTLGAARKTR